MKMDVSIKPLKAESLAINGLNHPPTLNPPSSSRSLEAFRYLLDFAPLPNPANQ
jgi:hypothetical protein